MFDPSTPQSHLKSLVSIWDTLYISIPRKQERKKYWSSHNLVWLCVLLWIMHIRTLKMYPKSIPKKEKARNTYWSSHNLVWLRLYREYFLSARAKVIPTRIAPNMAQDTPKKTREKKIVKHQYVNVRVYLYIKVAIKGRAKNICKCHPHYSKIHGYSIQVIYFCFSTKN